MHQIAQRLDGVATTVFAEMSALAVRTGALNLGQGFPDSDGPSMAIDVAVDALRTGRNQYPPGAGIPELRDAIAHHQRRFYGLEYDPASEVLVTTGATEAVAAALLALINPGDEVLCLEPYYDSYVACLQMAGGVRVPITLRPPDFRIDLDRLESLASPRTKAILLNSPHNPTGMVVNEEERARIALLAVERDLVVITDEVYEHLTFDGAEHRPLATYDGMRERTLAISSGGKTFSFTGWKVGWATGPADLVRATMMAKQFLTYTSGAPLQPAIAAALGLPDEYYADFAATLQAKRDRLCAGLRDVGFDVFVPAGTYFVTTDIRPLGYDDGIAFCLSLPERCGVVAIPHEVFYDDKAAGRPLVRWAFCKRDEVLDAAVERLGGIGR